MHPPSTTDGTSEVPSQRISVGPYPLAHPRSRVPSHRYSPPRNTSRAPSEAGGGSMRVVLQPGFLARSHLLRWRCVAAPRTRRPGHGAPSDIDGPYPPLRAGPFAPISGGSEPSSAGSRRRRASALHHQPTHPASLAARSLQEPSERLAEPGRATISADPTSALTSSSGSLLTEIGRFSGRSRRRSACGGEFPDRPALSQVAIRGPNRLPQGRSLENSPSSQATARS